MKVSKVSVSRRASAPHSGHFTSRKLSIVTSGERTPSKVTSVGSTTGRSLSGTGTTPQSGQWIIGIGQPQ